VKWRFVIMLLVLSAVVVGVTFPGDYSGSSRSDLAGLESELRDLGPGGVLIRREDVLPRAQIAYADVSNTVCDRDCNQLTHPWYPGKFAWSVFHVEPALANPPTDPPYPTPTATSALRWQEHTTGNMPPFVVKVAWNDYVETMEVLPNGTTLYSHPNILFHTFAANACDGAADSTGSYTDSGCTAAWEFDIDWRDKAGPENEGWSWIYFWVRDPDFVAMKAVDYDDCPTGEWQYEYINDGPKYSICQDFSQIYDRAHGWGSAGIDVDYDVLYETGVPPTATSGPTTTPPAGATPHTG